MNQISYPINILAYALVASTLNTSSLFPTSARFTYLHVLTPLFIHPQPERL